MQIETVKEFEYIYLVNDSISVPKNLGNSDYQEIQKWLTDGGTLDTSFSLEELKTKKINELRAKTTTAINAEYSDQKKMNIIGRVDGYNDSDFVTYNIFMTDKINRHRSKKEEILACQTCEEIEAISLEDNG